MREQQGHKELYRMGFDGACIEKLRHLTEKQHEELLAILFKFTDRNKDKGRERKNEAVV